MDRLKIAAIYGSPRRRGNTATLLKRAVEGAADAGAIVTEIVLRDLRMSPCLEIFGCAESGECRLKDDFQKARDQILASDGLMIATPVFFYTVSAHTKILMDRFQSLWVKKNWVDKSPRESNSGLRKALLIAAGATSGKKLFDGIQLSMKYFLETIDMELWKALLYRGLDFEGDVLKFPGYLEEAREAGREYVKVLRENIAARQGIDNEIDF